MVIVLNCEMKNFGKEKLLTIQRAEYEQCFMTQTAEIKKVLASSIEPRLFSILSN